ncbi:MAG: hypothetical protein IPJ68_04220 [Candidatus Moraniibacteriota bacterium]|nr:MAG: hypothetical protein IPJ68_04220 [Candidatus Moranbacteria bacterium]
MGPETPEFHQKEIKEKEAVPNRHRHIELVLESIMAHANSLTSEEIEDVQDIISLAKKGAGPGPFGDTTSYNQVVVGGGLDYLGKILLKVGKTQDDTQQLLKAMLNDLNAPK